MSFAANPQSSQSSNWGQNPTWGRPWGSAGWADPPFWHPEGMSRPLGIAMMILGFALWWPVGLALLFFMIFSGRIGCRRRRWAQNAQAQGGQGQGGEGGGWHSCVPPWANWGGNQARPPATGNHAFDEYRAETLRRLEEEQVEFSSFLERLRFAKDKAEFDQFMAERRRPPVAPDEPNHA